MRQFNSENIELVMFDYVEGNLTAEEMKEFDKFIKNNPQLKEEFQGWQNAFVSEPLPEKLPVEKKLTRRGININKPIVYFTSGFLLSAFLFVRFYTFDSDKKQKYVADQNNIIEQKLPEREEFAFNQQASIDIKSHSKWKPSKLNIKSLILAPIVADSTKPDSVSAMIEKPKVPDYFSIENNKDTSGVGIEKTDSVQSKVKVIPNNPNANASSVTIKSKRKLTKEEKAKLKKIAKLKQKNLQLQREAEFMSGDKPYVVPLNPNNF